MNETQSSCLERIASTILLRTIRAYQLVLSPWLGRQCRFLPTCSCYARDAIEAHGPWLGSWLAIKRLLSCRPGGRSGYDPVPMPEELRSRGLRDEFQ
jgi:putative membrane protein insertion efficiency factor